jgi:hypothetical protein
MEMLKKKAALRGTLQDQRRQLLTTDRKKDIICSSMLDSIMTNHCSSLYCICVCIVCFDLPEMDSLLRAFPTGQTVTVCIHRLKYIMKMLT